MAKDFLLLILSSPSGAGKTTLTRMLQERFPELRFSVSHTTRHPRAKEIDGKDYHFVDRTRFCELVEEGAFVEWAEVHGNLYGTSVAEIERARATPGCRGMIFDIDFQGARQIRAKVHDAIGVFILPPSMEELERRLRGRASDTEEVIRRRFQAAKREIDHYALFDYVIMNDDLKSAFEHLAAVVLAERSKRARKAHLAEALLRIPPKAYAEGKVPPTEPTPTPRESAPARPRARKRRATTALSPSSRSR
jgi:guanylate kinase